MRQGSLKDKKPVSRRTILTVASTAWFPTIAGCSVGSKAQGEESTSTVSDNEYSKELRAVKSRIESIYREINRLPIVQNGEFVFDVREFEERFDHRDLLEETRELQERIEAKEPVSVPAEDRDALTSIARLAELLVRERILTHQAIAAGLTYGQRLMREEYAGASEAVRDGYRFLEDLSTNSEEIRNVIDGGKTNTEAINGYDPISIRNSQSVLIGIVQWTTIIYRSFHHASLGFELFKSGIDDIKEERVGEAGRIYDRAGEHFARANELLNQAHGQGTRLYYVVPVVRKLRCVLPVYRDTSGNFADSFNSWQSGREDEARELGRKAIKEVDHRMAQCEDIASNSR